jgi:4-hydroxy-3-polyprenylbenzoate decarboxylase
MTSSVPPTINVALTGASGIQYGIRLIEVLAARPEISITLIMSRAAWQVALAEITGLSEADPRKLFKLDDAAWERVKIENPGNIAALSASGSSIADAMVVVPCSMKTLASIAHGFEQNLIVRAADCCLKEGRPLILVPRETPLHAVYLENMLKLARLGVKIVPAMPGFYHAPQSIDDLFDFIVMKICDQLGVEIDTSHRWKGMEKDSQ